MSNISLLIEKYVTNCNVIVDVGANKGREIKDFLRLSPDAKIYIFEPDRYWFKYLIKKFKDSNCYISKCAVADHDGELNFFVGRTHSGAGTLRESTNLHEVEYRKPIAVESCKLDTWYKNNDIGTIDFLWSDIEGSERELINGGRNTLKNTKYFYTEYHTSEFYRGQALLDELIDMLKNDFEVVEKFERVNEKGGDILFRNKNYE